MSGMLSMGGKKRDLSKILDNKKLHSVKGFSDKQVRNMIKSGVFHIGKGLIKE